MKMLTKLNKNNPGNFYVCYLMGKGSELEGQHEMAKKCYRECLKIVGKDRDNNTNVKGKKENMQILRTEKLECLAHCSFYLNNFEDCIEYCNKVLSL